MRAQNGVHAPHTLSGQINYLIAPSQILRLEWIVALDFNLNSLPDFDVIQGRHCDTSTQQHFFRQLNGDKTGMIISRHLAHFTVRIDKPHRLLATNLPKSNRGPGGQRDDKRPAAGMLPWFAHFAQQ